VILKNAIHSLVKYIDENVEYVEFYGMTLDAENNMPTNPERGRETKYRLAILPNNGEIHLSMKIERGTGKTHSKFQSTSKVTLYQSSADEKNFQIDFQIVGQNTHQECFNKVKEYISDQKYISIQQVKQVAWLPCLATKDPSVWYTWPSSKSPSCIPLSFCDVAGSEESRRSVDGEMKDADGELWDDGEVSFRLQPEEAAEALDTHRVTERTEPFRGQGSK